MESDCSCKHHIVYDLVDIDPDRSVAIYYCVLCYKTFEGFEKKESK